MRIARMRFIVTSVVAAGLIVLQGHSQLPALADQVTTTEYPVPTLNGHPYSIAAGPDGALWFTEAWGSHSLIWGFPAILALVPLAVLGALTVTRWKAALLSSWIIATVAFYSTYNGTDIHPRFLYVILPSVFVLWSAGLAVFINALRLWREAAP